MGVVLSLSDTKFYITRATHIPFVVNPQLHKSFFFHLATYMKKLVIVLAKAADYGFIVLLLLSHKNLLSSGEETKTLKRVLGSHNK